MAVIAGHSDPVSRSSITIVAVAVPAASIVFCRARTIYVCRCRRTGSAGDPVTLRRQHQQQQAFHSLPANNYDTRGRV